MKYWLATHQPHPVPDDVPWHIYFKSPPKTRPLVGDAVLFYETFDPAPGRTRPGEKAVVCVAEVSGELKPMSGIDPWMHQIPCSKHKRGIPVPLEIVRKVVEGPFYRQTLRSLSKEQFAALVAKMKTSD